MDIASLEDTDSITTQQFADLIGVSLNTVCKLVRDGKLITFSPATRNRRVRVSEAKRYCKDHGVAWPKPAVIPEGSST